MVQSQRNSKVGLNKNLVQRQCSDILEESSSSQSAAAAHKSSLKRSIDHDQKEVESSWPSHEKHLEQDQDL